mmetsp:Transcript_95772/g.298264  ORF Transcript_95772/g.298264 Transcript_95772/m.298264 type:complete len:343 (-) Transcript_95772:572-1600(-)
MVVNCTAALAAPLARASAQAAATVTECRVLHERFPTWHDPALKLRPSQAACGATTWPVVASPTATDQPAKAQSFRPLAAKVHDTVAPVDVMPLTDTPVGGSAGRGSVEMGTVSLLQPLSATPPTQTTLTKKTTEEFVGRFVAVQRDSQALRRTEQPSGTASVELGASARRHCTLYWLKTQSWRLGTSQRTVTELRLGLLATGFCGTSALLTKVRREEEVVAQPLSAKALSHSSRTRASCLTLDWRPAAVHRSTSREVRFAQPAGVAQAARFSGRTSTVQRVKLQSAGAPAAQDTCTDATAACESTTGAGSADGTTHARPRCVVNCAAAAGPLARALVQEAAT